MPWWSWLIVGFALLGGEMLAPGGFYLLFLGIGALIVGLLALGNLAGLGLRRPTPSTRRSRPDRDKPRGASEKKTAQPRSRNLQERSRPYMRSPHRNTPRR